MQKDPFGGNVIKLEFIIRIPESSSYVNSFLKSSVYIVACINAVRAGYLNALKLGNDVIVIVRSY